MWQKARILDQLCGADPPAGFVLWVEMGRPQAHKVIVDSVGNYGPNDKPMYRSNILAPDWMTVALEREGYGSDYPEVDVAACIVELLPEFLANPVRILWGSWQDEAA